MLSPISYQYIDSLPIPESAKCLAIEIMLCGSDGASTLWLHEQHHGSVSRNIKLLKRHQLWITSKRKKVTDKRGTDRNVANHVIYGVLV